MEKTVTKPLFSLSQRSMSKIFRFVRLKLPN